MEGIKRQTRGESDWTMDVVTCKRQEAGTKKIYIYSFKPY